MFQMMQDQQRQYQEAAERRFKLELEEIRQRAKEERFDMVRFMADLQLQGGKTSCVVDGKTIAPFMRLK